MSLLFRMEGVSVRPTEEALMVEPFATIWFRDGSKDKGKALKELAYIEFVASMFSSNPYRQYPEKEKPEVVAQGVFNAPYKPDKLVLKGIELYKQMQTSGSESYRHYMNAKLAAEKTSDFIRGIDLSQLNPKTMNPVYKPKDVTDSLVKIEEVISNLSALRKRVSEELFEHVRTRAQKKISPFADPESLK